MDRKKIKIINKLIRQFQEESDFKQGYVHIEFCNGIHNNSWGTITARDLMSGESNYTNGFHNIDDLIQKLNQLKEFQNSGELY